VTTRKITVRGIFDKSGDLIRILVQNGGGKTYFMDCEPSKDASIDEFLMELIPPQDAKPILSIAANQVQPIPPAQPGSQTPTN
jgi:hypothetical protein